MEIRTHLFAARYADFTALCADRDRLDAAIERALRTKDMEPEDVAAERVAYREIVATGCAYAPLSDREKRRLDRILARLAEDEIGATRLASAHAYRFDWVLGFLERRREVAATSDLWYHLAHGRRLRLAGAGSRSGEPEHVPYYAWLDAAECARLRGGIDGIAAAMEAERPGPGLLRRFERRGYANDAAYLVLGEVRTALDALLATGADLLAVTRY